MINIYDKSKASNNRKLACNDLLFVEYHCPAGAVIQDLWSQYGHIVFVSNGKKVWFTADGALTLYKGDALYCKKGAYVVHNYYDEDVCILLFFLPESFIHEVVQEYQQSLQNSHAIGLTNFQILQMQVDLSLKTFFESVMSYFSLDNTPSEHLLKLKFKELVLQILTAKSNTNLANYFLSLSKDDHRSLAQVMQDNCLFNLSLEAYAKLCHRSLSTFKRDFFQLFHMPPGKWLIEQRLKYAKMRLLSTEESVTDIAFHSGFETTSHFIRSFKKRFGSPPHQLRQQMVAANSQ